ncbi:MAG: thiamine biosynthesis pyrophosphatase-like protein [Nitrososphaeraceae archaeon]|nr:thiamine biosynthesis pyrophosphatase-like protein [Nitrososphaeraceae archaeon]
MTRDTKQLTLLIFPTSTALIKDVKLSTIKILKKNKILISQIIMEKDFFSLYTKKTIKALRILSSCLGIKKIEIAYSTSNDTKSIVNKIVSVGKKIIINEKFYIKIFSENPNFVARDLEFIATGLLIERLASKSSLPSHTESSANKILKSYIGKSNSYICIKTVDGIGGMTFGYINKEVFIIIYDQYSIYCLKNITLRGFIPDILILFWDLVDLKNKLFSIHAILNGTNNNKIKLQILQLNFIMSKTRGIKNDFLLDIVVINICSYINKHIDIILPFNLFVHPMWLIDYSINTCLQKRKIPWFPYLFEDNLTINLDQNSKFKSSFDYNNGNLIDFKKERNRLRKKSSELKKNIKTFYVQIQPLNVRPNYIDNILNSI